MKSIVFTGKDKFDVEKQIWDWRSAHPKVIIEKIYPEEMLPVEYKKPALGSKILAADTVSKKIDYEEKAIGFKEYLKSKWAECEQKEAAAKDGVVEDMSPACREYNDLLVAVHEWNEPTDHERPHLFQYLDRQKASKDLISIAKKIYDEYHVFVARRGIALLVD